MPQATWGDWQSYSRTWDEQRFSPLTQINDRNVGQLGLAWYDDLQTQRGVQGSPLVIGRRALQCQHLQYRHGL